MQGFLPYTYETLFEFTVIIDRIIKFSTNDKCWQIKGKLFTVSMASIGYDS